MANTAVWSGQCARNYEGPGPSIWFCVAWLLAAAVSVELRIGLAVYLAVLAWSSVRAMRRPIDGLWLLFFTLAVVVVCVPLDYTGEFGGDAPVAYQYWGFALACLGGAMFVGSLVSRRRFEGEARIRRGRLPLFLFLAVVLMAAVYGYGAGNSIGVML